MKTLRTIRVAGKRRRIVVEELLKEILEVVLILRSVSEIFVHWVIAVKFEHSASPHASSGGELVTTAQRTEDLKFALWISCDCQLRKLKLLTDGFLQKLLFNRNEGCREN